MIFSCDLQRYLFSFSVCRFVGKDLPLMWITVGDENQPLTKRIALLVDKHKMSDADMKQTVIHSSERPVRIDWLQNS